MMNQKLNKSLLIFLFFLMGQALTTVSSHAETPYIPICYLQKSNGEQINLTNLCGSISPTAIQSCNPNPQKADLPIVNVNYDGNILTGTVKNQSCKTVKYIKVNYEVKDEVGNVIDNGFIYAEPLIVQPGEVASFRGNVTAGETVQPTHVDWMKD